MRRPADTLQLPLFADLTPLGDGRYTLTPRKPVQEVGPAQAAKILGVHPNSLANMLNRPLAARHIKWRWSSDACGKRLYDAASLAAYRTATSDLESHAQGRKGRKEMK